MQLVGSTVTVKVAKNKVAPPFKTAEFEIEFGKGISKEGEIIDFGLKYGLVGKSGNWYSINGENISNGKENFKKHLKEHTDLREMLLTSIRERLSGSSEDDESALDFEVGSDQEDGDMALHEDEAVGKAL